MEEEIKAEEEQPKTEEAKIPTPRKAKIDAIKRRDERDKKAREKKAEKAKKKKEKKELPDGVESITEERVGNKIIITTVYKPVGKSTKKKVEHRVRKLTKLGKQTL